MTSVRKKLLIIDDDVRLSQAMAEGLGAEGFEVKVENEPRRATRSVTEFMPDLIVCDVMMPGKSGGGVVEELRANAKTRDIPILFLTSLIRNTEVRSSGMYLAKPISITDLTRRIRERLS